MIPVGTEPSYKFPIGSIIEDPNARMKILEFKKCRTGHIYKVEVLEWFLPPPDAVSVEMDINNFWILVLAEHISKIKVIQ